MKTTGKEAKFLCRAIPEFLDGYAPNHLTSSPNTLKSYKCTLQKYLAFLQNEKHIDTNTIDKACFERQTIEEWMRYMRNKEKLLPDTCNIRLGNLRSFLNYLGSRDIAYKYLYLDAIGIPLMKTQKKKVEGLTKEAVKVIMEEPDQSTRTGKRDLVFMIIAYGTAARIDEILSIKLKDIHLTDKKPFINIIGKGNKMRALYLLPKAVVHIRKYIELFHGDNPDPEAYLFYSRNGDIQTKISQKAIEKRLHMYGQRAHEKCADIPINLHAHQFRHARATHWIEEGINIAEISVLLGHEQIATTMRYLDIPTADEAAALAVLEDENDKKVSRKWKKKHNSLTDLIHSS